MLKTVVGTISLIMTNIGLVSQYILKKIRIDNTVNYDDL